MTNKCKKWHYRLDPSAEHFFAVSASHTFNHNMKFYLLKIKESRKLLAIIDMIKDLLGKVHQGLAQRETTKFTDAETHFFRPQKIWWWGNHRLNNNKLSFIVKSFLNCLLIFNDNIFKKGLAYITLFFIFRLLLFTTLLLKRFKEVSQMSVLNLPGMLLTLTLMEEKEKNTRWQNFRETFKR